MLTPPIESIEPTAREPVLVSAPDDLKTLPAARTFRFSPSALIAVCVAAGGMLVRLLPWAAFKGRGFDEALYENYLRQLMKVGLLNYPDIIDAYVAFQKTLPGSILPPTRFLYIFCAYLWQGIFGGAPLEAFHSVSKTFSILTLLLAGWLARRWMGGGKMALAAFALMAFSPLQIHMAQHALADGFFEFWALLTLWALWECLQRPGHRGWLALYAAGLALMVTTKENAFFVFVAVLLLLALNRWLRFGTITPALLVLTGVGPLIGVAVLINLAGGVGSLCGVYMLSVPKNLTLPYAILTGDGPWYRYLIDLMTISPLVLVLALAMAFQLRREDKALLFGLGFIVGSYLIMANLKYGMNLRYATMWDLPLRLLAVAQLGLLAARFGQRGQVVFAAMVAALCAFDLHQYHRLAVAFPLYELVPMDLLRALNILK
jgi:4-amino-4-deoxy-L-arabinose transferase-like glycosyltransferase